MKFGRTEDMAQHLLRIRSRITADFLHENERVLEIGPGEAVFDKSRCDYIGINISKRGSPQVLADGQQLPFRDATIDAVVATEVIEHVRYPYKLLREIRRVTKPSGRVLLSTPNAATPVNRIAMAIFGLFPDDRNIHDGQDVGHIHFFTRRYLLEAVHAEGFTVGREWGCLLQIMPRLYIYDTVFESFLRNYAKVTVLELRPSTR